MRQRFRGWLTGGVIGTVVAVTVMVTLTETRPAGQAERSARTADGQRSTKRTGTCRPTKHGRGW